MERRIIASPQFFLIPTQPFSTDPCLKDKRLYVEIFTHFMKGERVMLYKDLNDETLVMLTLAGEQNAYEVLVTRYQSMAISAAASITHRAFMAEDAAQDAFVTAWMKLDTLKEPQKFGSWVCKIAKNCALNMLCPHRFFRFQNNSGQAKNTRVRLHGQIPLLQALVSAYP